MKIVYIGIDILYEALPALAAAGCEISEIVTCRTDNKTEFNLKVCDFAKRNQIPLFMGKITSENITGWKKAGVHAVICCGYYYRIPVDEELPMVNIHPSLLPIGRGAWPMPVAILKGMSESGITIHKITKDFDEGDILMQTAIPLIEDETLQTLTDRLKLLLPAMMTELTANFKQLYLEAYPQGEGEFWPCLEETDYPVTSDMDVQAADRILRAFYGYECIYQKDGECYGVTEGRAHSCAYGEKCEMPVRGGTIIAKRVRRL